MRDISLKKEMKVSQLKEHPKNKEYFSDIKETNPAFWLEFVDSIKRFGIIEPLLVNKNTKYIRSGNQRYKAALELGMDTVPVVLVDDDVGEDEISEMIASNVFRRQIDPFKLFDYIAELRKGSSSIGRKGIAGTSSDDVVAQLHKPKPFVSAADLWQTLTDEQKEELKQRFTGELNHSEGKLIAEMRKIEAEKLEAMEKYRELSDATRSMEERERAQQEMVQQLQEQIDELKARDVEEELAERDARIRALEKQRAALNKKLQTPDLNKILDKCIKDQREVSSKLSDLFKHKDQLDEGKMVELGNVIAATIATIRNNGKEVLLIGEEDE